MKPNALKAACIWTVGILLLSCVHESDYEPVSYVNIGDRLPRFEVGLSDGSHFTTDSIEAPGVVIVFFNTSCADCRRELPLLQASYQQTDNHWRYVCISREEDSASIARYWTNNGLTLPYSAQTGRRIYSLFASSGIPRMYVADSSGTVIDTRNSVSLGR